MPKDSEPTPEQPKVLDLLDSSKKSSRRERQREEASKVKTLDDAKRDALDLFSDEKKPKVKKKAVGKQVLPSISKVLDEEVEADAAAEAIAEVEAGAENVEVDSASESADDSRVIVIKPPILVNDLAASMGLKPFKVMGDLIKLSVFVKPNQPIDPEIAAKVCELHGFQFAREKREKGGGVHKQEEVIKELPIEIEETAEQQMKPRPPIVTIMGHVDHGKTTLLDRIRNARVAAGEAGGITQHIGAYQVKHNDQLITFLDTPGHAIFSNMRARGADITDVVVLVVAANDGLMPQTLEAIKHAKAANKTILVAINKCDLQAANVMHVKTQLAEHGLQTTDFGGDTEFVEISALTGMGVDDLLELLVLQTEVLELKSNPKTAARAVVIEARLVQGRGPSATVIVESGTLKAGVPFVCGPFAGKVRTMLDDSGNPLKLALPGTPVEIVGFEELPNVGDHLAEMKNERAAKALAAERQEKKRLERLAPQSRARLENLFTQVEGGGKAQLKLILKGDVQGSVEAIRNAVLEIESSKVECVFVTAGVGPITENDIDYANSTDAVVLGFNVKVEAKAVKAAKAKDAQIKLYSVVYELIDQVREAMLGLLDPVSREKMVGHAEVKQVFKLTKGRAGGCYVTDGKIVRKAHARVLRGGIPVFDGKMSTLRRFQDEVEEVKNGLECGIRLGEFNDYQEGDIIECYHLEKVAATL